MGRSDVCVKFLQNLKISTNEYEDVLIIDYALIETPSYHGGDVTFNNSVLGH